MYNLKLFYRIVALLITLMLLFGCTGAPAQSTATDKPIPPTATYTLIPLTSTPQPTFTFTPIPTNTSAPTATEMPCTDMGWSDIDGSLKYFGAEVKNLDGMKNINVISLSVDITYIQQMIDGVNQVQVATCTQNAKNLVVTGMNAFLTYCKDLSSSSLDQAAIDKAKARLKEGKLTFIQANTELSALGIKIGNLEYLANHFSNQQ